MLKPVSLFSLAAIIGLSTIVCAEPVPLIVPISPTSFGTLDFNFAGSGGTGIFSFPGTGPYADILRFGSTGTASGGTGALAAMDGRNPQFGYSTNNNLFVTQPGSAYQPPSPNAPVNSFPEQLFVISNGAGGLNRITFTFDAFSFSGIPGSGPINIDGYLTESFSNPADPSITEVYDFNLTPDYLAPTPTITSFAVNSNAGTGGFVSYTATLAPTPEPSSLMLLGTGVLSLAAAIRRRVVSA